MTLAVEHWHLLPAIPYVNISFVIIDQNR